MAFRPKCQKFPDCGYSHFSHEPCGPSRKEMLDELERREKGAGKKKSKVSGKKGAKVSLRTHASSEWDFETRIAELERRVDLLETRKKYQKELMRKRRAQE